MQEVYEESRLEWCSIAVESRLNDRIRAREVRVVGPSGEQLGVMDTSLALSKARSLALDLVEVAPQAEPPVCKIMDYSKFRYEQDVKAKEARKRQQQVVVKEMKFKPKISSHDFDTKKHHIERFLNQGSKVKITVWFRGREMQHVNLGARLLTSLAEQLSDIAVVETSPKLDGKNMTMVLAPVKKPERKGGSDKPVSVASSRNTKPAEEQLPQAKGA